MTWQERLRERNHVSGNFVKDDDKKRRAVHFVLEGNKELLELLIPDSIWQISNIKLHGTGDHQDDRPQRQEKESLTFTPGASSMTFSDTPFGVATVAGTSAIVEAEGMKKCSGDDGQARRE